MSQSGWGGRTFDGPLGRTHDGVVGEALPGTSEVVTTEGQLQIGVEFPLLILTTGLGYDKSKPDTRRLTP